MLSSVRLAGRVLLGLVLMITYVLAVILVSAVVFWLAINAMA